MKNNKKKSPMMKIVSAAAMLAVSASMLGTSTYAWFTMNTTVTVTGLQTTAKAEDGIVIAAYTDNGTTAPAASAYAETAAAYNTATGEAALLPTFTEDASAWYHNWSKQSADGQVYGEDYTAIASEDYGDYFITNKFKIKSPSAAKDIYVKSIAITNVGREAQAYDPSLRVLVKSGETVLIFNQNGTAWTDVTTKSGSSAIATPVTLSGTVANTADAKIMTASTTGTDVEVYVYYDGQDAACKSDNITAFTSTNVTVTFTSEVPV